MIPPEVVALVARAVDGPVTAAPAPTTGGFSHLTFRVGLGGEACVVKAASVPARRAEVRNEAAMLTRVAGVVPVPRVIAVGDDDDWTALVTAYVSGTHGLVVVRSSNVFAFAGRLGAVLRLVHDRGLLHGDPGFHNTIWDARGGLVALLDWEWGGVGDPLGDVAWVWWTFRFRSLADAVWDAFVAGYGPLAGWELVAVRTSIHRHMDRHLARVAGDASLTQEWLRRREVLGSMVLGSNE